MNCELTKNELEKLWLLYSTDGNAKMCFVIDDEYYDRFGLYDFHNFIYRRVNN